MLTRLLLPIYDVPTPVPTAPTPGAANAVGTLLGWTMWGALAVIAIAAIASTGFIAGGHITSRPHVRERGLTALGMSLLAAVLVGAAIPLVNSAIKLGGPV